MYKILHREELTPQIFLFRVEAPAVASKAKAGQFVIIRMDDTGERIPLTIADWDRKEGSITIVFQKAGASTRKLAEMKAGDSLANFSGPLGVPSEVEKFGTVLFAAGGVGVAPVFPIARALKEHGNHIISVQGARSKDLIFWEDKLRSVSDEFIVTTDDGSYGRKGVVTLPIKEILESGRKVDRAVAIGPAIMMKFSALTTKPFGIKTLVSLNPIMVDGTGMCGCCRVEVGGKTKFSCVDGPEFDGHAVDWDLLLARQRSYLDEEKVAVEHLEHQCRAEKRS